MTDEEIAEAMVEASYDADFGHGAFARKKAYSQERGAWPSPATVIDMAFMRSALSIAKPLIAREARERALKEAVEIALFWADPSVPERILTLSNNPEVGG